MSIVDEVAIKLQITTEMVFAEASIALKEKNMCFVWTKRYSKDRTIDKKVSDWCLGILYPVGMFTPRRA